ncbi:hypothetical protein, partial [Klebsiella variicola]|uniref:hypothetical protein n=1 Tax=Klebsiella variicola TaxID=244366 RepID=UPI0019546383
AKRRWDDRPRTDPPALPGLCRPPGARSREPMLERIRKAETIGRPLGDDTFIDRIADVTGRILKPGKRGPKPRGQGSASSDK